MPLATATLRLPTRARQRNADDPVAKLAREAPQPGAFGPEDPRDRTGDVGVEQAFTPDVGAEDPDALAPSGRAAPARDW